MPPDEPPPEGGGDIPPEGEGMPPPDGGMGMVTPPDVCTPPMVLQPVATTAATASVSSGFSKGLTVRLSSLCRIGVRLS